MPKYTVAYSIDTGTPPKTQPDAYCEICEAKLSRYRKAGETICASHRLHTKEKGMAEYTKAMRAGKKALEELGYEEVGMAGNTHLIMEHPYAGRLYVAGTPASVEGEVMRKVQKARRQIANINAEIAGFVEYLRKKYMVPDNASVVVQTTMQAELRKWAASRPSDAQRVSIPAMADTVLRGEFVKMLKKGRGKIPSTIEIYGKHFVPPPDDKAQPTNADKLEQVTPEEAHAKHEPICGAQHPQFPGVWCTLAPDHDDMHMSEATEGGWFTSDDVKSGVVPDITFPPQKIHAGKTTLVPVEVPPPATRIPAVGAADVKPQVAIDTNEVTPDKTPQGAGVLSAELLEAIRKELFPSAQHNADKLAQCKNLVKEYREAVDAAYEILYRLENLLDH